MIIRMNHQLHPSFQQFKRLALAFPELTVDELCRRCGNGN